MNKPAAIFTAHTRRRAGRSWAAAWRIAASAALLVLASFSPCLAADQVPVEEIRIFVPESLTDVSSEKKPLRGVSRGDSGLSTTFKKVIMVGRYDGGGDVKMQISNNNRSPIAPAFYGEYFHAAITLSLGSNLIEMKWNRPGQPQKSKFLSIFRSSKIEGDITSDYPPYVFHRPKNEEECQACHQMRLTKEEIETGMERSCLKCHLLLTENPYVHGPVTVGICTVCHDPESPGNKYTVEQVDTVLCYDCHTDREVIDSSKRLQHGPVGAGLCTICHDAHSSQFEFQLVKSKNDICLLCHQEDADQWRFLDSQHPPFRDGNCVGCHDPHSSDYDYNLKEDKADICALCHDLPIPGHLHNAGGFPKFSLPLDFPLTADGKVMCLTCHDPHGAQGDKLTRRIGCDGCHPK